MKITNSIEFIFLKMLTFQHFIFINCMVINIFFFNFEISIMDGGLHRKHFTVTRAYRPHV